MVHNISIDRGKAYVKAVTATKEQSFPSILTPTSEQMSFEAFAQAKLTTIRHGGVLYAVGDSAYIANRHHRRVTRRGKLQSTDEYVLYLAAIGSAYPTRGGELDVTASLPVGWWDQRENLKNMLLGPHEFQYCGANVTFDVKNVQIVPEGLGTLAYYMLAANCRDVEDKFLAENKLAVIDIGGRTTDVLAFDRLNFILGTSRTKEMGIIDVREQLSRTLQWQLDRGDATLSDDILDRAIRTRTLVHRGAELDVSAKVEEAVYDLAQNVLDLYEDVLEGGIPYSTVFITGGGGPLIGPYLIGEMGHQDVRWLEGQHAYMANARGAFRYSLFLQYRASRRGEEHGE